jgi:pimeloyl-ACP methyl ester carboxylesterase
MFIRRNFIQFARNYSINITFKPLKLAFDKHSPPINTPPPLENIPPLIFLHGLFGSKANNRSVSKQLAKILNTDVYCIDLRNHGDSPHGLPHNYQAMSADVEEFINNHKLIKPIIIGHSMGAKCAMAVNLNKPDLCSGLISIDNAPVDFTAGSTGFSKFGKYIAALQEIEHNGSKLHSLKDCDLILSKIESSIPIRQFLLTNMRKTKSNNNNNNNNNNGGYKSRVPLDIIAHELNNVSAWPYSPINNHWNGPSLFIRGTQSAYIADEYLSAVGEFFPAFQCVDIDAGHWVVAEKPKEFVEIVVRWINAHEW